MRDEDISMKERKWCQESGGKGREGEYHRRLNTDNHKSCRKKNYNTEVM